jgi:hypothetical protein
MRKTQRRYRHASKILDNQIMKFHNASISELQRKDVINKATNYGKHKTDDATIYKLALDTLKEAKVWQNVTPLGKQLEKASIESGYHNSKGKWVSTFYVTTNLSQIDFKGLGVAHQTHDQRMKAKTTLKDFKSDIDRTRYISKQSD